MIKGNKNFRIRTIFFIILYFIFAISAVAGENYRSISKDHYGFAEYLFKEKDYYRASTEYQRVAFANSDTKIREFGIFKTAECFYFGRQYNSSIDILTKETLREFKKQSAWLISLNQSKINIKASDSLNNEPGINQVFREYQLMLYDLNYFSEKPGQKLFQQKWRDQISSLKQDIGKAESEIIELPQSIEKTNEFLNNLEETWPPAKNKNSTLAALFSAVIPGLGYLYNEEAGNAISAFVIVGFFTSISYLSFQNNEKISGYTFAGIGSIFYAGNIYGAYKETEKQNNSRLQKYKTNVQNFYLNYKAFKF